MFNWELSFGGMRCRKINEAKLILCRIAIAEEGKPYRKDITPQYHTFLTNMKAAIGRHVNATSRKRVEIQAYRLSEKEKKNISRLEFVSI